MLASIWRATMPLHHRPTHLSTAAGAVVAEVHAHSHHRRGRHDRPQADRAAGRTASSRPADREADAARCRARRRGPRDLPTASRPRPPISPIPAKAEGVATAGRGLPSGRRRLRRSRARFRKGLSRQSRRHARAARSDPRDRRRLSAQAGLHLVDRGVRRAVSARRFPTISISRR